MKVLISWQAKMNDFVTIDGRKVGINENGTHCELYKNDFAYDTHVLLCSENETNGDTFFTRLCQHLRNTNDTEIISKFLDIKNVISVEALLKPLRELIISYADEDIDIFISPGTPAMQTAWYLLGLEFPEVGLFQTLPPRYRPNGVFERKYVTINPSISSALAVREGFQDEPTQDEDIHKSESIQAIYDLATDIASPYPITTLILGQTGTGKEWLANHIHKNSTRNDDAFLAINCAGLNDDFLSSELFGHVEGAYTGATHERTGAFELANNGTLFLDEIGDISKKMQQTLLRVLQEGEISKLGSHDKKKVNVRVIAATNKDLFEMTETGVFRADLYYRLAIAEIETLAVEDLPPEEREDYIQFFIQKWKRKLKRRKEIYFTKEAKRKLGLHPFPGNFRELENLIERFYTYAQSDGLVTIEMFPKRIRHPEGRSFSLRLEDVKNAHYRKVYRMFKGNKTKMWEALDIGDRTWKNIVKRLELE